MALPRVDKKPTGKDGHNFIKKTRVHEVTLLLRTYAVIVNTNPWHIWSRFKDMPVWECVTAGIQSEGYTWCSGDPVPRPRE